MAKANFDEIGTLGLSAWSGYLSMAYDAELYWPQCAPLYDRIWRSDPEVAIARTVMDAMSGQLSVGFEVDPDIEEPTDDDLAAVDFGNEVLDDIDGGIGLSGWLNSALKRVPFYGWGYWETPLGLRQEGWAPPDREDPWRSTYDDGLVGIRHIAFRHYSTFDHWDLTDKSGRLRGMYQLDPPNPTTLIPLNRALHVTFGDLDNPEGLAVMESLWRLERLKYNLELILGIGFEHSAGHVSITSEETWADGDEAKIKRAVRALLTAQEGNYAAWPKGVKGEVIDVPFQAADALIDAIRYYGVLKLGLVFMQWAALGTLSPYGSYSSMQDANQFFLAVFNSMAEGFVQQADSQVGRRLYEIPQNAAAFPLMTKRPRLVVSKAQKVIDLAELATFMTAYSAIAPLSNDDLIEIRSRSGVLPEVLPEVEDLPVDEEPEVPEEIPGDQEPDGDDITVPGEEDSQSGEMAVRPFVVSDDEEPTMITQDAYPDESEVRRAVNAFKKWAQENEPDMAKLLDAKVIEK